MGRRGVPDRWLKYNPLGERIPGTPFITFKVPLKEALIRGLPEKERFTPQVLLESVPNLGLIIDLTNTDRYYNRQDFLGQGIQYAKIFCRGHEIPSQSVVERFFSAVDDYLEHLQSSNAENDDGKLIGVHCTHGLNRTGYLVCRYMIRRLGFTPEDAIAAFEKARGYPMERDEYLKSLRRNEESPKSPPIHNANDKSHRDQDGIQNNEDPAPSDSTQPNVFPHFRQNTWAPNDQLHAQDMRTGGFVDFSHNNDFRRFPANGRRAGSRHFSEGMRSSSFRDHRADFCHNFKDSSHRVRSSNHPYRSEFDPEERFSGNGRMAPRRFYEQDFDGNQSRRPRRFEHRSRSSFYHSRDSVHHRNNWRDFDQRN